MPTSSGLLLYGKIAIGKSKVSTQALLNIQAKVADAQLRIHVCKLTSKSGCKMADDDEKTDLFHMTQLRQRVEGDGVAEFPNWKQLQNNLGRKEGTLLENEDLGPLQAGGDVKTAIAKLRESLGAAEDGDPGLAQQTY